MPEAETQATTKEFALDVDELTVGDLETIEEMTGMEFNDALNAIENLNPKCVLAFVFCVGRHENPDFSLDDARKVKLSSFQELEAPGAKPAEEVGDEADPPAAAPPAS